MQENSPEISKRSIDGATKDLGTNFEHLKEQAQEDSQKQRNEGSGADKVY
jgi:hypothetical protein